VVGTMGGGGNACSEASDGIPILGLTCTRGGSASSGCDEEIPGSGGGGKVSPVRSFHLDAPAGGGGAGSVAGVGNASGSVGKETRGLSFSDGSLGSSLMWA
jgi:hypothetical protein